jgi:SAM-dependent methyltransferase
VSVPAPVAVTARPALRWHPPTHPPATPPPELGALRHPSRRALHRVLTDPYDGGAWQALAADYDAMAGDWSAWAATQPQYAVAVAAGLAHARPAELAVEIGCGTGQATVVLDALCTAVLATDVNASMLCRAPTLARTRYLRVDVRRLPFADASVALLVGLNAVPHLAEFARVLRPDGQLLWCTSFGAATPLYVPPRRLVELLGAGWRGQAGRAGHGEWTLLERD